MTGESNSKLKADTEVKHPPYRFSIRRVFLFAAAMVAEGGQAEGKGSWQHPGQHPAPYIKSKNHRKIRKYVI